MSLLTSLLSRIGVRLPPSALSVDDLAALVDATPTAVVAVDAEGVVRVWNAAAERLLG
jgi:PAS domain-containing protein